MNCPMRLTHPETGPKTRVSVLFELVIENGHPWKAEIVHNAPEKDRFPNEFIIWWVNIEALITLFYIAWSLNEFYTNVFVN